MGCAGYTLDDLYINDQDTCQGDDGGPLVDAITNTLVGVVSYGAKVCGTHGAPSIHARVAKLREFIDEHMD